MAKHGGIIAPDGRRPQAPGVGKSAKRHDLERPATPGLSNSDLQQGDVQRLEQAQRTAPRAGGGKTVQAPAQGGKPAKRRQGAQRGSGQFSMATPDPIEMAAGRIGGQSPSEGGDTRGVVGDSRMWMPLMQFMAAAPNSSGPIAQGLIEMYSEYRRNPVVSKVNVIDMNELDRALGA